jgi:glycosyltransferase involved in cell wall biosynthesis
MDGIANMENKVNTTIVVSNFNYSRYLDSAIRSCIDQSVLCKIIVVDDASTDPSWDVILSLKKEFSNYPMKCVRLNSNSAGNARGKNIGICLSTTPFIVCLDSDDLLTKYSVQMRENILVKYPHIQWVHGDHYDFRGADYRGHKGYTDLLRLYHNQFIGFVDPDMKKIDISNDIYQYKKIMASTVMVNKNMYLKYGLYREDLRWKIDKEMWHNLLFHGEKKGHLSCCVSLYRRHTRSATQQPKIKNVKEVNNKFVEIWHRVEGGEENIFTIQTYDYLKYIKEIVE